MNEIAVFGMYSHIPNMPVNLSYDILKRLHAVSSEQELEIIFKEIMNIKEGRLKTNTYHHTKQKTIEKLLFDPHTHAYSFSLPLSTRCKSFSLQLPHGSSISNIRLTKFATSFMYGAPEIEHKIPPPAWDKTIQFEPEINWLTTQQMPYLVFECQLTNITPPTIVYTLETFAFATDVHNMLCAIAKKIDDMHKIPNDADLDPLNPSASYKYQSGIEGKYMITEI